MHWLAVFRRPVRKENMRARLIRLAWAGAMIFGGCGILWATAGWKVAAGTFLIMWGHYVEKHHTANSAICDKKGGAQ